MRLSRYAQCNFKGPLSMEEKDRKDLKMLHAGFEGGGREHKPRNAGENWQGPADTLIFIL